MYDSEYFLFNKKQFLVYNLEISMTFIITELVQTGEVQNLVQTGEVQNLVFTIPIFEPLPTQYYVRAISDRWLGSQFMCPISFQHLILPERHPPHTGAPTGSGKTIAAEMAIFRVFREYPNHKVGMESHMAVYIAPLKALVRERMEDWKVRIEKKLGKKVVELTGDVTPDMRAIAAADLIVTTPEKWDGVSRSWQTRNYVKAVAVLIIDEIHLLGNDRGPVLEVIVSRTNFISSHTSKPVRV
ncbi:activating 3 signal cointegrator 1 complex subunit, partial [Mytilus galloprovincialis]